MSDTKTPNNEPVVDLADILPNIEGLTIIDDKDGKTLMCNEVDLKEPTIVDEDNSSEITIVSATPYNLSFSYKKGISATLSFLCRDEADKLFVLSKTYILDSKEDVEMLQDIIPFADRVGDAFPSDRIAKHMLNCYLDSYSSELLFRVSKNPDDTFIPRVYFHGYNSKDNKGVRFNCNPNIFACIAFIDQYIMDIDLAMENEHDLALASVGSSRELDDPTEFFIVDKIDDIVEMARAIVPPEEPKTLKERIKASISVTRNEYEDEETTEVGAVIKLKNANNETVYMLAPFDLSEVLDESKFKGKTISDIQDKYFGDSDQYVSSFMIPNIRLYGAVDKEYMIIRGRTKSGLVNIFLFDRYTIDDLYAKLKGEK